MLIKYAYSENITSVDIKDTDTILADSEVEEMFTKYARELKVIAPKAKDFLYFTAIMMHAAEAALLDNDGNIKKDAFGRPVEARWEKVGEDAIKWVCSDPNIKPTKNNNGDIFTEHTLKEAHKLWRGKPLCIDHQSSSVDHVRGLIVDTVYDPKHKRVIALCALDKLHYPDLAHKVATGYSASVSMGTAVGRAICTEEGCHAVARRESDFCEHMRRKSGYGEINEDLSPIELSIVVNGADPKAKIKQIIAKDLSRAAASIEDYMEKKVAAGKKVSKEELLKINSDLALITKRLNKLASEENADDENDVSSEGAPYGVSSGAAAMAESEVSSAQTPLGTLGGPVSGFAAEIRDLQAKISELNKNFEKLSQGSINKNESLIDCLTSQGIEENNMTENKQNKQAYFLGGGGVNEPTPGRPKYEKDPTQDQLRMTGDKHMVGQPPFPGVGPVDGMHPGPQSAGVSEQERKRQLLRLAAEERRMKREAAIKKIKDEIASKKDAYFLGGGGVNEPTPGKTKYPPDPRQEEVRNKHDKHMVGQKPFPNVGPVDGMHPGPESADVKPEEKRKQKLLRAEKLTAKFVRTANEDGTPNHGESAWEVYAGKNRILTATVNEITSGKADVLFDAVATKDFGQKLLQKIRTEGFDKVKSLYKSGQVAPAPEAQKAVPGTPPDAMGPAPIPADMQMEEPPVDPGVAGAPEESVGELAATVRDLSTEVAQRASDLAEAAGAVDEEGLELADVPPADEAAFADPAGAVSLASLQSMRKTLNGLLSESMTEAVTTLKAHAEELSTSADIYENGLRNLSAKEVKYLNDLTKSAVKHAKQTLADTEYLKQAFLKYASGTQNIIKRAQAAKVDLKKVAQLDPGAPVMPREPETTDVKSPYVQRVPEVEIKDYSRDPLEGLKPEQIHEEPEMIITPDAGTDEDVASADDKKDTMLEGLEEIKRMIKEDMKKREGDKENDKQNADDAFTPPKESPDPAAGLKAVEELERKREEAAKDKKDDKQDAGDGVTISAPGGIRADQLPPGAEIKTSAKDEFDLTTKEGRAAARTKLAQTGIRFSDMPRKAHPGGSATVPNLDVKPSGDLGVIEDIEDAHKKMMDVATAPPRVRKAAEEIAKLVANGELAHEDVDHLAKHGVDQEAISYYKKFWGEAKDTESSEFASKLVKDYAQKKAAEERQKTEVKIKRAYDMAYEMVDRGLINRSQVKQQVDEITKWNDEQFDSYKRIIANHPIKKQAMPRVGMMHSEDIYLPVAEGADSGSNSKSDLVKQFEEYFASKDKFVSF